MSKWITQYEAHAFHAQWKQLKDKLDEISSDEIATEDAVFEVARLKKVVTYIDSYMKIIDPEINVNMTNVLNSMQTSARDALSHINSYLSNKNIGHLHHANNYIDTCLTTSKQLNTVLPKVTGRSINSMLTDYNNTIKDALGDINLSEAIASSKEIESLKNKLVDDEDSIESQVNSMLKDTEEKHAKLVEFYNNVLNDEEYNDTTKELISKAKEKVEESQTEISGYLKKTKEDILELSKKIEDFEKYYVNVFGEIDEDVEEEVRKGGLKEEIESRLKSLEKFDKDQQKVFVDTLKQKVKGLHNYEKVQNERHNKLFEHINSLLPSATSAGLATAYYEERGKFKDPIMYWNIAFIITLLAISIVSFFTLQELNTIEDFGKSILHTLPITGPLIWLAIYASKRRSENQRLEQEYAHKEALAKSYSSYKKQIEELNQEDQELLVKLLDTSIAAVAYNASETLDGKHGDNTPIEEILTKANRVKTLLDKS